MEELITTREIDKDGGICNFINDLSYLKSRYNVEQIDFYEGWSTGCGGYTRIEVYKESDGSHRIIVG